MEDTLVISRTIQILFRYGNSGDHILCKVDYKKLNWKLQKLQKEGMVILGLYLDEIKNIRHLEEKGTLTGRAETKKPTDGSDLPSLSNGGDIQCLVK